MQPYTEIFRLREKLQEAGIPFEFITLTQLKGYQIMYPSTKGRICSTIQHRYSYGNELNRLEIMGLLTPDEHQCDDVRGFLTADDVFSRIKTHWDMVNGNDTGSND